jgi:hypothetical protein
MNKQQLIALARERGVSYHRLTKAQLITKLNITITPKPLLTPQQKKERRAAYARKYYLKTAIPSTRKPLNTAWPTRRKSTSGI